MICCGDREKFGSATNAQRWDYINLSDFKSTSCWSPFSYGIVYIFLIISIAVYAVDLYTAANLLFFDRWSSQVKPAIPFEISRWVFAGCIILSWVLLAYRWIRALRAMRTGVITASYLDPLAVRIESIRPGQGRGWRRFLVFAALTKGRKGSEYVALFTYFSFEAWLRIVFAEGPRQVINALTLWSVLHAKLIPVGAHAPNDGHTPIIQFFVNVKILANANTQQATILFGMLYVLIIWVFSAIALAVAFLMYILFLWHHIPSADGSLTHFCRRKIEKRLNQIVRAKVDKAMAKEQKDRIKKIPTGGIGASVGAPSAQYDLKREPTLPSLDGSTVVAPSIMSKGGAFDSRPASPFGARPESPFRDRPASPKPGYAPSALSRQPTVPDMESANGRPSALTRNFTQSSQSSATSFNSDAPLMSSAATMGFSGRGPSRMDYERSGSSSRPPTDRSATGMSQHTQRSASAGPPRNGPSRSGTPMSGRSNMPGPGPYRDVGRNPYTRDGSSAPPGLNTRRPPGPQAYGGSQEYEMQPPNGRSGNQSAGRAYAAYMPANRSNLNMSDNRQPFRPPPTNQYGEYRAPSRAGTVPNAATDRDDFYGGPPSQMRPHGPPRAATAGNDQGASAWNNNSSYSSYNPPRF